MTHLKAKSFADYSQKKFEEKLEEVHKRGAERINNALERAEKYPECTKLSEKADERRTLNEFLEWLQGQGIWLCNRDEGSNFADYSPITKRPEAIIFEFLEIDEKKLEAERREILKEQRRANGDTEADDES